jgi:uncharacterized protein (DUF1015 family)
MMNTIKAPRILLPKSGVDMTRFSVIACDQFTSQIEYWNDLKSMIGSNPSTFHMVFPEAYLHAVDNTAYIKSINQTIDAYLQDNILEDLGECFILVERSTPYTKRRLGLMLSVDLDAYTYEKGLRTPIRATEATILERIPPRLRIRENAPVELPHTLILFDDPGKTIIEDLYARRESFPKVYDFELNQNGGHLKGYLIKDTDTVIRKFYSLLKKDGDLLFVVGDGNHSLATAKAHWEKLKATLPQEQLLDHPARYSLVEAINLYDEGLTFEAIHRVVFNAEDDFIPGLRSLLKGKHEGMIYTRRTGKINQMMPENAPMAYKIVQDYIDQYLAKHPQTTVDYIHGTDHLIEVADKYKLSIAIEMPALTKGDLFDYIAKDDVLPRKSFSMGHAQEKRYYLECKRIR